MHPSAKSESAPNRSKASSKSRSAASPVLMLANPLSCGPGKGQRMDFDRLRRREFITLFGGAVASPTLARGQQQGRTAHIGVFSYSRENDPQAKVYIEAFLKRLAEFGWSQGANLRIEYRWTGGDAALIPQYAAELSVLALDVVLVAGGR